ncbi:MAG TPA: pilus assembly protein TadG-related protein [Terriglobia bacterium]|nr:pilus assembly protein TadG-related protein [Terriglobia bacterium]
MEHAHRRHGVTAGIRRDEGQVSVLVLLATALFVLLFVGFGVDMTNLYFHRQAAQGAADSACQAGAMDMFANTAGTSLGNFTTGTNFDCAASGTPSPCQYAMLNGYSSPGLTAGADSNDVKVSFPASVAGVTTPSVALTGTYAFMQVDITDRVKVYFSSLITRSATQDVLARSRCGMVVASQPVPIIVLDPTCTHSFQVSGASTVTVVGGPPKSIQVNSDNTTCAAATIDSGCAGSGTIDLSQAGPALTGGTFGVFGAPQTAPANFLPGTTGTWLSPSAPIQDPYKLLPPPGTQPNPTVPPQQYKTFCQDLKNPCSVFYGVDGCPDPNGCVEYGPGQYSSAIIVKGVTAIFDPGIYYITGTDNANCGKAGTGCTAGPKNGQCRYGFEVDSGGVVRPATPASPSSPIGGTMFYLSGSGGAGNYGSVFFGSNAGAVNNGKGQPIDTYNSSRVTCAGGPAPNPPLPSSLVGDVLLGPCTGTYGGPGGINRGMLFFQDRSNADTNGQPSMQGGGGLLLGGNLYFHNCPESLTAPCAPPPTDFNAFLQFQGNPGSATYVYGNITTDELITAGNGTVTMELNPTATYSILKVALLQ